MDESAHHREDSLHEKIQILYLRYLRADPDNLLKCFTFIYHNDMTPCNSATVSGPVLASPAAAPLLGDDDDSFAFTLRSSGVTQWCLWPPVSSGPPGKPCSSRR